MKRLPISNVAPARFRAAETAGDDYGVSDSPDWRSIDWPSQLRQT